MSRPFAVALGAAAVLHVGVAWWAWSASSTRGAGSSEPAGARVPVLHVELRPSHAVAATRVQKAADEAAVRVPAHLAKPQRPVRRAAGPSAAVAVPLADTTPGTAPAWQENDTAQARAEPAASSPAAGKSMDDILKSVPTVTRAIARSRAPNAELAASAAAGARAFAPLERALSREEPGEQRLANGVTRVVTKDGASFCLRELRGGQGGVKVVSTCP